MTIHEDLVLATDVIILGLPPKAPEKPAKDDAVGRCGAGRAREPSGLQHWPRRGLCGAGPTDGDEGRQAVDGASDGVRHARHRGGVVRRSAAARSRGRVGRRRRRDEPHAVHAAADVAVSRHSARGVRRRLHRGRGRSRASAGADPAGLGARRAAAVTNARAPHSQTSAKVASAATNNTCAPCVPPLVRGSRARARETLATTARNSDVDVCPSSNSGARAHSSVRDRRPLRSIPVDRIGGGEVHGRRDADALVVAARRRRPVTPRPAVTRGRVVRAIGGGVLSRSGLSCVSCPSWRVSLSSSHALWPVNRSVLPPPALSHASSLFVVSSRPRSRVSRARPKVRASRDASLVSDGHARRTEVCVHPVERAHARAQTHARRMHARRRWCPAPKIIF